MVYINTSRTVRVEWTIMRDRHVKEDMKRAEKVKYILHTPSGRMTVNADVDNPVVLTMPTPLEEGEYGVECIWTKNRQREIIKGGGKTICKAKADAVFVVTSDATKAPATTATAVVKVKSYVGIYGYDGLDAWELAVMNGKTDKNEREWTSLFANLQAALDEGTYPSTGDYAVDAVFTPENTNHLATTGAIYDALKASVGLNDMAALGEDMGYGEVNPKDAMLTLPLPRTAAVVNITMQVDNDELHKPGPWGRKTGKVEYFDRDGNYFVRNATISRQGETSVGMAQSNMKIEIGTNDLGQESPIKFGDWVPQESFHLKAYYIDVFRGVSIVGYRLAEQAIQQLGCRPNRFKNEANNTTEYNGEGGDLETYNDKDLGTDALCHPDGFPVEVFINKEYYGLMVWALRKQRANYQMDENNQEEVLLEGNLGYNTTNGESPSGFFQPNDGLIDWSAIEFKNPRNSLVQNAKVLAKQVASASWKAYFGEYDSDTGKYEREEKINSSDEATAAEGIAEAKAAWEAVYDKDAVLLYYLLSQVVYNYDGFSKNWVWSIYNTGTTANPEIHAAPNVYDLDSVFGRSVQGSFVIERSTTHLLNRAIPRRTGGAINYAFALPTCFAWYMYKNELNEMYGKLRNSGVFSTANIVNLLKGWIASVGRDAYARNMRGDTNKWGIDSDNPIPSYRGTNLNTSYWKIKNDGSPTWVNAVWEDNAWVWNIPESITPWSSATDYAVGDECWDYSKVYTTEINTTPRRLYWKVECVQACTNKEPLGNAMADYMPYDLGMFDSVPRIEKWLDARLEKLDDEYKYVAPVLTSLTDVISVLGNPDGALVKKGEIIVKQGALSQGTDQWKVSIPKGTEFTIKVEDPDHVLADNETFYIRMMKGTKTHVGGVRGAVAGQEYSLIAPEDLIGIGLSSNKQEIVLADGSLTLTYKKPDDGLFSRVEDLEYASKGESNETKGNLAKGSDVNFLMFSDVHQDTLAVQHIMQQATAWGNDIDFVLNGGDTVSNVNNSGLDWYNGTGGLVENAGKPVLDVIGNHDAWHINEETEIRGWDTDENITSLVIQPMVERGWVSSTNKPYYVKDFPADNPQVRFIVLCAMAEKQDGQPETSHYWDSNQADFLIRILNDARTHVDARTHQPHPLPVVIVNHCSFDAAKATGVNCPFTSWIGSARTSHEDTLHLPDSAVGLVDNFIRDGGQFVCWLTGHRHRDVVSYIDKGNGKQFCFSTAAANHDTSRNYDSYRSGNTQDKSYDCYNLIGVDTTHGWLKIMRIGLNTDQALREKEEMVLDYVNGKIVNDPDNAKADKDDVPNDVVRDPENAQFVHIEPNEQPIGLFYLRKVDSQLAGLMTAADKQKLDGMPAGTYIPVSGQMNANGFTFVDVHGTPLFTIPFAGSTGGGLITFNDLSRFIDLGTKQELDAQFATKANKAVVDAIQALIPSQATASNQLADKDFVNSSVATSTATFRGSFNLVVDLSLSVGATHAQIAAALGTHVSTADNNDYAFVSIPTSSATPTEIAAVERYKFNGSAWVFEYALNNSGFTAAQWAAINSGITALLVTKLQALPTASDIAAALNGKADKSDTVRNIGFDEETNSLQVDKNGSLTEVSLDDIKAQGTNVEAEYRSPFSSTYTQNVQSGFERITNDVTHLNENKVEKITGKGLSTEDYTTAEKGKLAALPTEEELDDALATKANTDGWYPRMVVGAAESLIGKDISVDEATDYVVQGATGIAKVNEVMGRSEKWNQLIKNGNFADGTTDWNVENLSKSEDDNFITFTTTDATYRYNRIEQQLSSSITAGHHILVILPYKSNNDLVIYVGSNSWKINKAEQFTIYKRIIVCNGGNMVRLYDSLTTYALGDYFAFSKNNGIKLVDLTDIYGAGNEPTTVEQFEADVFAKYGKTLDEYFGYDAGSINNANVESIKVYDDNNDLRTELPINIKTITGKVNGEGESVTIFPNGMRGVGTAYDSLIVDEDGWARRAVVRMATQDLGASDMTYGKSSAGTYAFYLTKLKGVIKSNTANIISDKFINGAVSGDATGTMLCDDVGTLYFALSPYTDAATFKAAMNGVELIYELATPIEYVLDEPILMTFNAYNGGVIRQIKGDMELATRLNITFALNVQGFINNANKAFVSAASMQAFLTKLSSAKGGTWGMTYNATTQQYEFTYNQ